MREILFRGKRIDNDEWIEGFMVICDERYFILSKTKINCLNPDWLKKGEYAFCCFIEVDPETVGQFTGLTDKNGKKIFEGDIVKDEYWVFTSLRNKELRTKIGYVDFSCDGYGNGYWAYWWDEETKRRCNFGVNSGCEVIGNIHDNPELLEKQ